MPIGPGDRGPIPFFALCEHHALPFFGYAQIGYLPHQSIIGISKLTRLVRLFAKRFTVQERLGEQIVNTFDAMLEPHGVALYLQAHHLCVEMRGVRDTSPLIQTTRIGRPARKMSGSCVVSPGAISLTVPDPR